MLTKFLLLGVVFVSGCAEPFTVFHSQTGEPILLGRRAYSYEGCLSLMREEAARLGISYQFIHVRGTTVGRNLLWPFEQGYACEGAIGPDQLPSGTYQTDRLPPSLRTS
jgi:hypothetical protein